jgi:GTP-binding protein YchF
MLSLGIVGLPNAGKSSLFKALTAISVPIANYPFTTIEPHHGVVSVPDERLKKLSKLTPGNQVFPTVIEFIDIAGLIEGAHKGEGLGNQFLAHIREVDGILEVVRLFEDKNVAHPMGTLNPRRDINVIDQELIQADLKILRKGEEEYRGRALSGDKFAIKKLAAIKKAITVLEAGRARDAVFTNEEQSLLKEYNLLTQKPIIFVWNVNETGALQTLPDIKEIGIAIPLKFFADLSDMHESDTETLKREFGISKDPLEELIRRSYEVLGLITFFTVKPPETRAWAIKKGTLLPDAGGVIHSDFKEKFIRAEVIPIEELLKFSSWQEAKAAGKIRIEGKEYIVQDGDVIEFKI